MADASYARNSLHFKTYLRDPISVQVKNAESIAFLQALHPPDPILSEHQNSQVHQRFKVGNGVQAIVVKIEEDEAESGVEMLDPLDEIVLKAQETKTGLIFQDWNA